MLQKELQHLYWEGWENRKADTVWPVAAGVENVIDVLGFVTRQLEGLKEQHWWMLPCALAQCDSILMIQQKKKICIQFEWNS